MQSAVMEERRRRRCVDCEHGTRQIGVSFEITASSHVLSHRVSSGARVWALSHYLLRKSLVMERPPQLDYAQNWDAAIDITLRRLVYGSLSGATSALLLFRNPTTRWAAVAFGAGAGVGSAFTDSSELFRGLFGVSFSAPKHVDSAKPEPVEAQA